MSVVDFTGLPKKNKAYAGANGNKICVVYEGEQYMLKFPPVSTKNKTMSYSNSCFSEYLGCQIYESIKIPVQKTVLGKYRTKDKEKIVVACRDFTEPGVILQDFASLKNQMIDSARNGYGTELDDILYTFDEQTAIDPKVLTERFWDMFVVDAFIGNWDRHNGNWGFLYDTRSDTMKLAPVFDCGSSLYPQMDEQMMEKVLADPNERNLRIFEIPTSSVMLHGKRIKYFDFLSSGQNEGCNQALRRIVPRINMTEIERIVQQTPFTSDLQKKFYITMLSDRKERILDYSLEQLSRNKMSVREKLSEHKKTVEDRMNQGKHNREKDQPEIF